MFWRVVILVLVALIGILLGLLELYSVEWDERSKKHVKDTKGASVDAEHRSR